MKNTKDSVNATRSQSALDVLWQSEALIAVNKPAGVVSTAQDTHRRPTVVELVPAGGRRLYPVGRLDYNNVYRGVNVSPLLVYSHDVGGNTPLPLGNFLHGRRTITVGAEFTFQNAWAFDLRYVNFFGADRYNLLGDRDYLSCNLKYSF